MKGAVQGRRSTGMFDGVRIPFCIDRLRDNDNNLHLASSPVKHQRVKCADHDLPGDSPSCTSIDSDSSELPGSGSPVISEEGDISQVGEHSGRRLSPICIRSSSVTRDMDLEGLAPVDIDEDMEVEGQHLEEFTDVQGSGAGRDTNIELVDHRGEEVNPNRLETSRSTMLQEIDEHIPPGQLRDMAIAFHDEFQEENRRLQDIRELRVMQRRALRNVTSLSKKLRTRLARIEDCQNL